MIAFLIIVAIMMIVITMTMIIILWSDCIHKGHQTSASPFAQQCSLVKYKYKYKYKCKYKCKYKYNNMYPFLPDSPKCFSDLDRLKVEGIQSRDQSA